MTQYRGCNIFHNNGKWIVFGKEHKSLDQAKQRVDEAYIHLQKSIK